MGRALAVLVLIATAFCPKPARAEQTGRLRVDWSKLATVLRQGNATLGHEGTVLGEEGRFPPPVRAIDDIPWLGSSAQWALIARDWTSSRGLMGTLSLMDRLRPIRSSRMIVSRVGISEGRVMPFIQMGLGQWRIDTDLMLPRTRDVESAGQFGGGVEVLLGRSAAIAIEADETILYREQHEAQMVCQPHIWGSLLAARFEF